jgi:hypothetical protein
MSNKTAFALEPHPAENYEKNCTRQQEVPCFVAPASRMISHAPGTAAVDEGSRENAL